MNRWIRRIEEAQVAPLLEISDGRPERRGAADGGYAGASEEGSSAWALAPDRTTSNAAILMRNPHLNWTAGYWEVHVVVPGRLDFYGDFRIGGPLGIIGGFNRRLGFATTNNSVENTDVRAGEKLGQERRESGGPWRSKNRPPEICLRKRSQEERFEGYRRDVHSGAICTRSARGLC